MSSDPGCRALEQRCRTAQRHHSFAGPDVSFGPFQVGRHDVVNEPVLVDQTFSVELILKFLLEYLLENILETAIVGFRIMFFVDKTWANLNPD